MIEDVVVDTNVAVVANCQTEQASEMCIERCIDALQSFPSEACLFLDDRGLILDEYRKHLKFSGQPGVDDAFFKWLWDNQANEAHCRKVPITLHDDRGFEEFPDDPKLAQFDRDDRMFVAVALASGTHPTVMNASDRDWWIYRKALKRCGVAVTFLCPELMTGG